MLTLLSILAVFSTVLGNNTPLVGILSLPCYLQSHNCPSDALKDAVTYIPASYVKWLEGGGARVVPVLSDADESWVSSTLLPQLNGLLFTGGTSEFSDSCYWWTQYKSILATLRNFTATTGKSIPIWSTCLSFQALLSIIAEDTSIVVSTPAEDDPLPIDFTSDAPDSRIFNSTMNEYYSNQVYKTFNTQNVSQNSHNYGVLPKSYQNNEYLQTNVSVLGYSYDTTGQQFITLIETLDELNLNWYGSQFHPEKIQYVFDPAGNANAHHDLNGVFANQYLAEFFVNECRIKNDNTMTDNNYWDWVIFNYNPYFVIKEQGDSEQSYEQIYMFEDAKTVYGY